VIKEDGISGLYDGLTSSLLGIAITNGFVPFVRALQSSRLTITLCTAGSTTSCEPMSGLWSSERELITLSLSSFEEVRAILLRAKKTSKGTLSMMDSILMSAVAGAFFRSLAPEKRLTLMSRPLAGAATSILSNPIWVVNVRDNCILSSLRSLINCLGSRPAKLFARRSRPTLHSPQRRARPSSRRSST
jgi:adenine nucleotide transporter 17